MLSKKNLIRIDTHLISQKIILKNLNSSTLTIVQCMDKK